MHKMIVVLAALCLTACATTATAADKKSGKEPKWVMNPRSVYAENQYVSAVGFGKDRAAAEKKALGELVAIFGQNVKGETTVNERYTEAVRSGSVQISSDSELAQAITTSYDLDTVVGAEVKDVWSDGKGTTYAVAVMEKAKCSVLYANLIETNEETIGKLTTLPAGEENSLDAYARYDLAAAIADTNAQFLNVLSVLNPAQAAAKKGTLHAGDQLRLECLRIAQNIPIEVRVSGDREDRIRAAFASTVSDAGFKSGGEKSRYVLDVSLDLSEAVIANPEGNKYARYVIDAKLTDTAKGTVLLPFSINGREGHVSLPEAENRALRTAEKKIKADFSKAFSKYLVQLTSK